MQELKAGVTDAAVEKHVPVYTVEGSHVHVVVGEPALVRLLSDFSCPKIHPTSGRSQMKQESITIISKRIKKKIRTADILYIIKSEYLSLIHLLDG